MTMTSHTRPLLIGCLLLLLTSACHSEYHQRVEAELAKGVREDSLFLGITFGMSSKEFYAHCWELNKRGLIREGTQNTSVMYEETNLKHPAVMNFYPDFYEEKIYEMPVTYSYKAWAPWNKELFADSLQQDLLTLYKQRYGDNFIAVEHPTQEFAYVRVDGNRRISIFKEDDTKVKVVFTDLLAERKMKESSQANL